MNKNILLKKISERIDGVTKSDVDVVLETFEDVIFDTFKADSSEVPAKDGISAINGKPWHTDTHKEIAFKMSKTNKNI